jgi:hypothetical protein
MDASFDSRERELASENQHQHFRSSQDELSMSRSMGDVRRLTDSPAQ